MCIFCEIAEGKIPSYKVYEDDLVIAFLDLSQVTLGHTLVLPKKHYETLLDCPKEVQDRMIEVASQIAKKQLTNLQAKGYNILNNGYAIAGQSVMHAHLHVIPRYDENDKLKIEFTPTEKPDYEKVLAKLK